MQPIGRKTLETPARVIRARIKELQRLRSLARSEYQRRAYADKIDRLNAALRLKNMRVRIVSGGGPNTGRRR
jgi:hypothetical protein